MSHPILMCFGPSAGRGFWFQGLGSGVRGQGSGSPRGPQGVAVIHTDVNLNMTEVKPEKKSAGQTGQTIKCDTHLINM